MDEIVRRSVERAIVTMREKLGEQLTTDDMARSAMFSKFHFSRVFHQATGVSPGRFLSAMRLAEAKRLLLSTSITVADISHCVGYNSVGTFSTRFSGRVGVSPTAYRQLCGVVPRIPHVGNPDFETRTTTVRGHVFAPSGATRGLVFIGLFPGRIIEGHPVRYTILDTPGPYVLHDVPEGSWHLLAHCVTTPAYPDAPAAPLVGHTGPILAQPSVTARLADVHLRPTRSFDPPVLMALPDLRPAAVAEKIAA